MTHSVPVSFLVIVAALVVPIMGRAQDDVDPAVRTDNVEGSTTTAPVYSVAVEGMTSSLSALLTSIEVPTRRAYESKPRCFNLNDPPRIEVLAHGDELLISIVTPYDGVSYALTPQYGQVSLNTLCASAVATPALQWIFAVRAADGATPVLRQALATATIVVKVTKPGGEMVFFPMLWNNLGVWTSTTAYHVSVQKQVTELSATSSWRQGNFAFPVNPPGATDLQGQSYPTELLLKFFEYNAPSTP